MCRYFIISGVWLIENRHVEPSLTRADKLRNLIRMVPAPDFPTGGYIVGRQGAVQAYMTGHLSSLRPADAVHDTVKRARYVHESLQPVDSSAPIIV